MTDHDLSTLVREHVRAEEPAFLLSAADAIAGGRRTVRRRRAVVGLGCAAVLAVTVGVTLPRVVGGPSSSGETTAIDPATRDALAHYDARRMPQILDEHASGVLGRSVSDLGPGTFFAGDDQGQKLPPRYYDKASAMSIAYGGRSDHRYTVSLSHDASGAEGNARQNCADDVSGGIYLSCVVTTRSDGAVLTSRVTALRPSQDGGWAVVNTRNLAKASPGNLWFSHEVKAVHSKTFVSDVEELVKAPSLATAKTLWKVPFGDLQSLATDPDLVIPKPPTGQGGCPWTLPGTIVSCS